MSTNLKLIFGFPVAEWFIYSQQLYYSIKKFCHDPLVLFASNADIGYSYERLKKIKPKRNYRLCHIHNFLFDVFEEIRNWDFDYFVKLDSDCLFANFGFEEIFAEKFDFLDSLDQNDKKDRWFWTKEIVKNVESYQHLLSDLKLTRKDSGISRCLCAFQAYSKRAVNFIAGHIRTIENNSGYARMEQENLCLSDFIVPSILKDAGFEPRRIHLCKEAHWAVRYRPYIRKEEVEAVANRDLPILYHPLARALRDKARRTLLKKIGYKYGLEELLHILRKTKIHI